MTQEKKYSVGTTSENANNVQHIKISRKKKLFLLFYTTKNGRGDNFMFYSAKTREINIKNSPWFEANIHLVYLVPIQDIAQIIKQTSNFINQNGGKKLVETKEISIFSHAWFDGPTGSAVCTVHQVGKKQMKLEGWSQIEALWAVKARFVMFGCNTASEDPKATRSFAEDISKCSNFRDVEVWGQAAPAKPSFFPNTRDSSLSRNDDKGWHINFTYMVGSSVGDGFAATRGTPLPFPPAQPMRKYVNGVLKERTFQNQFNDHGSNLYPIPSLHK